jgi:phospholipase C
VSDTYFGSGPVQTWPNRLFAHCATPASYKKDGQLYAYLNNKEYPDYPLMWGQLDLPCIFDRFHNSDASGQKPWKVYYDGEWPISSLVKYVYERWKWDDFEGGNVFEFRSSEYPDFFSDVSQGTLPAYSFIEPRYQEDTVDPLRKIPPNSNHPGSAHVKGGAPAIDIQYGEQLLKDVYLALAGNLELFKKTLLIVTYDEHGGCFDHVAPPPAVSPFTQKTANFDYTMYGPRVPAIFINPYIRRGSVLRPRGQPGKAGVFDHTSIIATLRSHFDLGGQLTARDGNAPLFEELVNAGNELNPGPGTLPELDLQLPERVHEPDKPTDLDEVDKDSLAYVMYRAVLEKRRRLRK